MIATEAPHPNFDGPDTPPHTDCLEDNDDYSSSNSSEIIEESALEHFSAVLQEAQRLAIQAEKARNERNQWPKRYTGKSATTMYRHKKEQEKMASKGFLKLGDFLQRKGEEAKAKARLAAIANKAATYHAIAIPEESEESSDIEGIRSAEEGLDHGQELEEEEPEDVEPHGPEDALPQTSVQQMLDNLRQGIIPDNPSMPTLTDHTLGLLRDHDALCCAREQLVIKMKEKGTNLILRGRITAMAALLNIFLNTDLGYSWRKASIIVATSQGRGVARARAIRHWVLEFIHFKQLPIHHYGGKRCTLLQDEDIRDEIKLALSEMTKGGTITAMDVVDVVASQQI